MNQAPHQGAIPPAPGKKGGCLKGCLITVLVLAILCAIAGYLIVTNIGPYFRSGSATMIEKIFDETLKDSSLPGNDKDQIERAVKSFTARIRNNEVDLAQGIKVMEQMVSGPLMFYMVSSMFEAGYLNPQILPIEEIQKGHIAVTRFQAGLLSGKISREQAAPVMAIFGKKENKNYTGTRQNISPEEVRATIKAMTEAADLAQVPPGEQRVSPAAELERIFSGAVLTP